MKPLPSMGIIMFPAFPDMYLTFLLNEKQWNTIKIPTWKDWMKRPQSWETEKKWKTKRKKKKGDENIFIGSLFNLFMHSYSEHWLTDCYRHCFIG